tara:strand:- start:13876 stop:14109 length:234 start_codon:yes stop_codon:yes gene_type:complete
MNNKSNFDMGDLVDAIQEQLVYRDKVSILDPDMNIWDAKQLGDRATAICLDTGQAVLIGAPWENADDLIGDDDPFPV